MNYIPWIKKVETPKTSTADIMRLYIIVFLSGAVFGMVLGLMLFCKK
jgi:hypothetical protein